MSSILDEFNATDDPVWAMLLAPHFEAEQAARAHPVPADGSAAANTRFDPPAAAAETPGRLTHTTESCCCCAGVSTDAGRADAARRSPDDSGVAGAAVVAGRRPGRRPAGPVAPAAKRRPADGGVVAVDELADRSADEPVRRRG
ncbi:MAG: hypothetical protein AAFV53_00330 [Myxococcota bacterium]